MTLEVGTKLGPYEITGPIGAGGMGVGCRARDTKLNCGVALKVLPEAFVADPKRLARFQREAEVLASLNHPNIAHIYGLEDSSDTTAVVLDISPDGERFLMSKPRAPMAPTIRSLVLRNASSSQLVPRAGASGAGE